MVKSEQIPVSLTHFPCSLQILSEDDVCAVEAPSSPDVLLSARQIQTFPSGRGSPPREAFAEWAQKARCSPVRSPQPEASLKAIREEQLR